MAIDDIDTLKTELPQAFVERPLPPGWDDDWLVVRVDDPEAGVLPQDVARPLDVQLSNELGRFPDDQPGDQWTINAPDLGALTGPGGLRGRGDAPVLPPDALAFYLPFHQFYPTWWGIYLLHDGVLALARDLIRRAEGRLVLAEGLQVARVFLYGHEHFHHVVEAFAGRLEVTHREPIYNTGFERLYQRVVGTDQCLEEALASAHGWRKVEKRAFRVPNEPTKREAALRALEGYVRDCGPGYRRATEFLRERSFVDARCEFAEENHGESLPIIPRYNAALWRMFPKAFDGIVRVNSRVNYLVHRDSSLAKRTGLGLRYLRYREVSQRLKEAGCQEIGHASGSHIKWRRPDGRPFPVPRHPGDLKTGTLAKIIKQAGLRISVSTFGAAP